MYCSNLRNGWPDAADTNVLNPANDAVTQSSAVEEYTANLAVDGSYLTFSFANNTNGSPAWLQMDLGAVVGLYLLCTNMSCTWDGKRFICTNRRCVRE